MARHKNGNWNLSDLDKNYGLPHSQIQIAVLMDIRDELKILNNLLGCRNFTDIPFILREIRQNTKRRKRRIK